MRNYKLLRSTDYTDSDKQCIKSIHSIGKQFFALLLNWTKEGRYFEISENLSKDIMKEMDDFKIIHLKWGNDNPKINEFDEYGSTGFYFITKDPSDDVHFLP